MFRRILPAAVIAAAFALTVAAPAAATEPTPQFVTVAWVVDNPDSIWVVPQHDPVSVTGPTVDFAGVQALVPCGRYYQIDGYKAGPTTDALIAGGVLFGPSNPAEDLAHGAPGTEATGGVPWVYFTAPDCSETVCTSEFTQATNLFRYSWDGVAAVRTEVSSTSATLTGADAIAAGCYVPVIEPPVDPPVTPPVVAELAHAGPVSGWMLAPALLAVLFGAVFLLTRVLGERKMR